MNPRRQGVAASLLALILSWGLILGIAIAALLSYLVWRDRDERLAAAAAKDSETARMLAEHAARSLGPMDLMVRDALRRLEERESPAGPEPLAVHALLQRYERQVPQLATMGYVTADGQLIATGQSVFDPPIDVRDRDYYLEHLSLMSADLYVGRLVQTRTRGDWAFPLSRAMRQVDGRLRGILFASVDTGTLARFYNSVGEGRLMALLGRSGEVVVATESLDARFGKPARGMVLDLLPRSDTTAAVAELDEEFALVAVQGFPLLAMVATPREVVLAPWRRTVEMLAGAVVLMVLGTALFTLLFWRTARQAERVQRELATANSRFSLAVAGAGTAIFDWDPRTDTYFWSPHFVTMLRIDDPGHMPSTAGFRDRVHPEDAARVARKLRDYLRDPAALAYADEYRMRTDDGDYIWLAARGLALRDEAGQVIRFAGSADDITARKENELALARAKSDAERERKRAVAANRSKSQFLTLMSHELRTPLNAIMGFAEIIRDGIGGDVGSPQQVREYASHVHDAGAHLLALINDILDLSKIEAGRMELHPAWLDFRMAAGGALRLVVPQAERRNVELRHETASGSVEVHADPRALKQILANLLANAIKFTPPGGRVRLAAEQTPAGTTISVVDNGIGMNEQELEQALQVFGQVSSPLSRREQGTGLGLPLVRGLVDLHGGRFSVHSTPGTGTVVTLFLPAPPAEAMPMAAQ